MKTHRPALFCLALMAAFAPLSGWTAAPGSESGELTLQQPASQKEYIIDSAAWTCAGTTCRADFVADMPALRSCKRVVAVTGAVASFSYRGATLSDADLAECNTRAKH